MLQGLEKKLHRNQGPHDQTLAQYFPPKRKPVPAKRRRRMLVAGAAAVLLMGLLAAVVVFAAADQEGHPGSDGVGARCGGSADAKAIGG